MDQMGMPSAGDMAKIGEATTGFVETIRRLFPGITVKSLQRGESYTARKILDDCELIKRRGREIGLSDQGINALISDTVKRHRRLANLEGAVSYAIDGISGNADPAAIDQSWLEEFQDHAEKASDESVRAMWGNLLAGEMNNPGRYSKRLMSVLSDMSASDARAFETICSLSCLHIKDAEGTVQAHPEGRPLPLLIEDEGGGTFNNGRFSYKQRVSLESFGLIDSSVFCISKIPPNSMMFVYLNESPAVFRNDSDKDAEMKFSPVFTTTGEELASLCSNIGTDVSLNDIAEKAAKKNGVTFARFQAHPASPTGATRH